MKKIILLVFTAFLLSSAGAQNPKMDDIRELMEYTGMEQLSYQIAEGLIENYKLNFYDVNPEIWDSMAVIIREGMVDLLDSIALIYDKVYSHEEIKSMIKIYQTPIGKRMIETMPLVTELSMNAGKNWAAANNEIMMERLAPLMEKYGESEPTYEDFYDPDEIYSYDNTGMVSCSKLNTGKKEGSPEYRYMVYYNPSEWDPVEAEEINPSADMSFMSRNGEMYALIIAETSLMSLQELKAAVLYNMAAAGDNMQTHSVGLRQVNGKEVLCMILSAELNGVEYWYYNYYYSGSWGVLQYIVFTSGEFFEKNRVSMEGILSGLFIE